MGSAGIFDIQLREQRLAPVSYIKQRQHIMAKESQMLSKDVAQIYMYNMYKL